MNAFVLEAEGISKSFPGVKALDNVSLHVRPGTMYTLMGEDGAGKSTLVKCLIGIYHPDKGSIRVKREPVEFTDTIDALHSGISMIHQELSLVPHMTTVENIWLERGPMEYDSVGHGQLTRQTQTLSDKLNIRLAADQLVGDLGIAARQMVEIAKAISWNADIMIMDESTLTLTESEVTHLFTTIHDLRARGKAIVYIGYKMDEIFAITDEISMLRDGTWVGNKSTTEFTRQSLIAQTVGRKLTQLFLKFDNIIGEGVLTVRNLMHHGVFHDVSFTIRRDEVLGMTGLVGAERNEVVGSLFGMECFDNGEVLVDGAPVAIDSLSMAIEKEVALLTEDYKKSGLFLALSILENMSIVEMSEYIGRSGFVRHVKMTEDCMEQIRRLNIKAPAMDQIINSSSGGNQQRALIARWLLVQPKTSILDEPTRGIDAGVRAEIYHLINELANWGVAVIMVSSELPEILGMNDRVMVMHEGRITGILGKDEVDQETTLLLAFH